MRHLTVGMLLLSLAILMLACGGDDGPTTPGGGGGDPDPPVIASVDPPEVTVGTVVTVTGQHFGDSGQLFVDGTEVATASWTDTSIVFTVPAGLTGTEIQIHVTSGGRDSAAFSVPFDEPTGGPVITGVDPAVITEGTIVTLTGQGFGSTGQLLLNDEEVPTAFWSDTMLMFVVPTGIYGGQIFLAVVSGGRTSPVFTVPFTEATERQLTFDGMSPSWPCWSADGAFIFFTADGPGGTTAFYSVPFDGGDVALLYDGPGNDRFLDVAFYQAGGVLWVSDETTNGNVDGDWEVWEGLAGFNPRVHVDPDHETNDMNERAPAWNHSLRLGVRCAWTQDRQAGNSMIYVERSGVVTELVSGFLPRFRAANGDRLAYLTPAPGLGYDIMVIGLMPGAEPELLYRDELTSLGLDWGYTGQIAYLRNGRDIWVMNEDATNHRDLTESTDQEAYPRFSPSGTWVAFTRLVNTGFEVFVARVP